MTFKEYFGLEESVESIYKYAPVYKISLDDQEAIVKRTKPQVERLDSLFAWQKHLLNSGIGSVSPIEFKSRQYVTIDDVNWILYPFIKGDAYTGELNQIEKAGELLGKMHSVSPDFLDYGFKWSNYDDEFYEDVLSDIEGIKDNYSDLARTSVCKNLLSKLKDLHATKCEELMKIELPAVDATWDYKASNIIYTANGPFIIDTDNAGHVPRIFDLALALLLFHTSVDTAPGRVFTPEEWSVFYKGYSKYVDLTDLEKAVWEEYLLFVYMDEVLWAISDLEDDEPERQVAFMKSLVMFDLESYKL